MYVYAILGLGDIENSVQQLLQQKHHDQYIAAILYWNTI